MMKNNLILFLFAKIMGAAITIRIIGRLKSITRIEADMSVLLPRDVLYAGFHTVRPIRAVLMPGAL